MKKFLVVLVMLTLFSSPGFCISISNDQFGEIVSESVGDITVGQFSIQRPELRDAIVNPPTGLESTRDDLKAKYEALDIEGLVQQNKPVEEIVQQYDAQLTEIAKGVLVLGIAQKTLSMPGSQLPADKAYELAMNAVDAYAQTEEGREKIAQIKNSLVE